MSSGRLEDTNNTLQVLRRVPRAAPTNHPASPRHPHPGAWRDHSSRVRLASPHEPAHLKRQGPCLAGDEIHRAIGPTRPGHRSLFLDVLARRVDTLIR
jgi:hypothetical protein